MPMLKKLLIIAIGGALGAISRYSAGLLMVYLFGNSFPYGTLFVNVLGSGIIGASATYFAYYHGALSPYSLLVMVGFLGALTTFSSFSLETINLILIERVGVAALNVIFNVALCLLSTAMGMKLMKLFLV